MSIVTRSAAAIMGPGRQARPVVQRVDLVGGEALEETVLDHRPAAGIAFLAGLEDQRHGAVEGTRLGQVARRGQKHRGVAVVATAVHAAVVARAVRERVVLLHRQRVHVGTQSHRPAARRRASAHDGDDAGLADAGVVLDVERGEPLGDDVRRAMLLEAALGMRVQVAAQRRELVLPAADVFDRVQRSSPRLAATRGRRRPP
jgi:hypothetical protein